MINPIIPMQVRVHSETGLSTPGPRGREGGEGGQHRFQCLKSETTRRKSKDASTHSKTTSPSLTVGHAEKPQSQQESMREPGLAAVARPKERDYLTGFGTLGTRRRPSLQMLEKTCQCQTLIATLSRNNVTRGLGKGVATILAPTLRTAYLM
ncbi:hypothetical protein CTAM01_01385 [Colletotrichum tamarilloi]|uniref:Uncharacterized protein n=1 Tax=Colletotrichum tamarilloi TaxID=1209934 RepID=A0ABQ9RR00_9PEZI|nr:uncharacterized protein CTAM01_01385 [Colletotrichum tamarilloi]KAK1510812.1 hypothetical protein CTAM01_01385 [Colletotrichum tamarilloi]